MATGITAEAGSERVKASVGRRQARAVSRDADQAAERDADDAGEQPAVEHAQHGGRELADQLAAVDAAHERVEAWRWARTGMPWTRARPRSPGATSGSTSASPAMPEQRAGSLRGPHAATLVSTSPRWANSQRSSRSSAAFLPQPIRPTQNSTANMRSGRSVSCAIIRS